MKHRSIIIILSALGLILLLGMACNLMAATPEVVQPTEAVQLPSAIVVPTEIPATSAPLPEPTQTTAPVAPTSGNLQEFSWFKMELPTSVASGASSTVIASVAPSDQVPAWDVAPQHEEAKLIGYAVTASFLEPQINIYPVEEFNMLQPLIAERVASLKKIINDKSSEPGDVPILPFWNAAQVFLAKPEYYNFQNGSGIGYITEYGQALMPINNYTLLYSFQGLSSDGKYWISIIVPLNHPDIQPTYDNPLPPDMNAFIENFPEYSAQIRSSLDASLERNFSPSLSDLKTMIQSIVITKQ